MKSIELFAGAGGLAIATANAGFEHEAVLEWDSNACDTFRWNKAAKLPHVRDWNVVEGDVVFQLLNAADYGVPQRRERVLAA